jgi:tRNA pseudouridine13 synthase
VPLIQAPVLKYQPSDFLVREVLIPRNCPESAASHEYFTLSKCGFTTMEATRILAEAFGLPSAEVTYGGLKDEDGITEQLVAMPRGTTQDVPWECAPAQGRYLKLIQQGHGPGPLTIGGLEGNAFRIVVRNLEPEIANRLGDRRKINFCFLNYYDIQRFGVPGGVRRTHHVGTALLESRWDDALRELARLGSPESASAAAWTESPEAFFRSLDPRVPSFHLSAYGSDQWNARLRVLASKAGNGIATDLEVEGIKFTYLPRVGQVREVLAECPDLPYSRFTFSPDGIEHSDSVRPTVIQTQIAFGDIGPDDAHPGRSLAEARFFLPSGCYATAALRQLFACEDLIQSE